ncbi:MAG: ABC transporter substrate-binding protein [Alicyclobacillus sp.]|nr:ABC transporter substrate-binding protein [Alicyclobacillus sp.]
MRGTKRVWTGVLLCGLLLAGCGGAGGSGGQHADASSGGGSGSSGGGGTQGEIRIGLATALTTEYTITGQYLKDGTEMAVADINAKGGINGRKIKLIEEDSGNTNPMAVNAFNKLVNNDNVVAIISPDLSTQLFAVMPIIQKAKIPTLISGTNPKLTDQCEWYFRLRPSDSLAAVAAAKFAVNTLHGKNIGIIHDTDEFGTGGAQLVEQTLKQLGANVVDVEAFNSQDKDLSGQLTNLHKKGATVVVCWGHSEQSAILMKQNQQLGFNMTLIGSASAATPAAMQLAGDGAKGNYVVVDNAPLLSQDPKVQDWVKRYEQMFHGEPDFHAPTVYDGVMMLAQVIGGLQQVTPQAIASGMSKISDYHGMANVFDFSKSRDGASQVVVLQLLSPTSEKLVATVSANG